MDFRCVAPRALRIFEMTPASVGCVSALRPLRWREGGRRADHEALIAKRLVPPALPSEILEGCCHIIDKDLSVSILSSAIQPGFARHARAGVGPTRHLSFKSSPPPT